MYICTSVCEIRNLIERNVLNNDVHILKLCFFSVDTKHVEEAEKRRAKEKELAKVSIKKEDVDLIVEEMEISKTIAERTLREHAGNVVEALASLTN